MTGGNSYLFNVIQNKNLFIKLTNLDLRGLKLYSIQKV